MKLAAEICEIIIERHLVLEAADLREVNRSMEHHLALRRADLESRVPCPAIGAAEAAAEWMRVGEGGIDGAIVGDAEEQLVLRYPGEQIVLGEEPIVRRVVEIVEVGEIRIAIGEEREHRAPFVAVL